MVEFIRRVIARRARGWWQRQNMQTLGVPAWPSNPSQDVDGSTASRRPGRRRNASEASSSLPSSSRHLPTSCPTSCPAAKAGPRPNARPDLTCRLDVLLVESSTARSSGKAKRVCLCRGVDVQPLSAQEEPCGRLSSVGSPAEKSLDQGELGSP